MNGISVSLSLCLSVCLPVCLSLSRFPHPRDDDGTPPRFRIPKPEFHPRNVDGHVPSDGIAEFHEASFSALSTLVESRPPHTCAEFE